MAESTASSHVRREESLDCLPASFCCLTEKREALLREEDRNEPKLLLSWERSNLTRDIFLVPEVPAGMLPDGGTSSRARYPRQQNKFSGRLPGMCSNGLIDVARTKLKHPLALEGMASPIWERDIDIRALLGVALAADGMHRCVGINVLQNRLGKPLEAFRAKAVNGKWLVERSDRGRRGVSSGGEEYFGFSS
jgi:hypothetical protein